MKSTRLQDVIAEQAMLGALIVDNSTIENVPDTFRPYHFASDLHSEIYKSICKMQDMGLVADQITIDSCLKTDELFQKAGGTNYLIELIDSVIGLTNIADYANIISDFYFRRQIVRIGDEAIVRARSLSISEKARNIIDSTEKALYELSDNLFEKDRMIPFSKALDESIETAARAHSQSGIVGVTSGFKELDKQLGGLYDSDLLVIAGRPSMGKTAFATNIAFNAAKAKLKNFENQREIDEKFKDSQNKFNEQQNALKTEIQNLKERKGKLEEKKEWLNCQIEEWSNRLEEILEKNEEKSGVVCCSSAIENQIRDLLEALQNRADEKYKASNTLETNLSQLKGEKERLSYKIDEEQQVLKKDKVFENQLKAEKTKIVQELESKSQELAENRVSLEKIEEELEHLKNRFDIHMNRSNADKLKLNEQIREFGEQSKPENLQDQIDMLNEEEDILKEENAKKDVYLKGKLQQIEINLDRLEVEKMELNQRLKVIESELETLDEQFNSGEEKVVKLTYQLQTKHQELEKLEMQCDQFKKEKEKQDLQIEKWKNRLAEGLSRKKENSKFIFFSSDIEQQIKDLKKQLNEEKNQLKIEKYDVEEKIKNLEEGKIRQAREFKEKQNLSQRKEGAGVVFFSLEMSAEQLATRILASESGIPSDSIRRGAISKDSFPKFINIHSELERLDLYIDDTPNVTISQIRRKARKLKRQKGIGLIVIDYLQLIAVESNRRPENRVQEISEITRGLKGLAKELSVPILALSQLSRAVEQREDNKPQLSDLRESGSIEQDADVVMFVFREAYYKSRKEPKTGTPEHSNWQNEMEKINNVAEIIIAKQRHGPIGNIKLYFDGRLTKFGNLKE
ncbi:MAG: AAA family ATPase [Holosporales bacterium]|jgi:replicative DNA helicase|nr:AAA family ATPase [Holosporales bacterium]